MPLHPPLHGPARLIGLRELAVVVAVTLMAAPAAAEPLRIQFPTQVASGEHPKLILAAEEDVGPVTVVLHDEAGRAVNAKAAGLHAGEQLSVTLPGDPGRHRFTGQLTITQAGRTDRRTITFETVIAGRLEVQIDRARVDLRARRLEARLSRPPARVEITVTAVGSDEPNAHAEQDLLLKY
jgi:hypothetical protein